MVARLDAPQPTYTLPSADEIPDDTEDKPEPGLPLLTLGPFHIPVIIYGAGAFSYQYNSDDHIASLMPIRSIRLALRYGIRCFDTSAYYGPSEIVLGTALKTLENEFPRSSYKLMTKCGRYGVDAANFDYSPTTIRASVMRSLSRLNTPYLDAVYLHDIEFVCEPVGPYKPGSNVSALGQDQAAYGLAIGDEGIIRGDGDRKVLEAVVELWKMQEEGYIKAVGITGYPLPTLLRLALLIQRHPPYRSLDLVLSYCHLNIQNDTLKAFIPHLYQRANVKQVIAASPLSMKLFTSEPPSWHPAPPGLLHATSEANTVATAWPGGLPNVALGYAMRHSLDNDLPLAIGYSTPHEVHESVRVWRDVRTKLHQSRVKQEDAMIW